MYIYIMHINMYICKYVCIYSDVTLRFELSPSRASDIDYFEVFSRPRESQLARRFFVEFNLLFFLIS